MNKIYSAEPDGNEAADLEPAKYFLFAKDEIKEGIAWLKTTNEPGQTVLVHIDVLVYLCNKYQDMAADLFEAEEVAAWKTVFDAWYERCKAKIPAKFREGIKKSYEELFEELAEFV